MNDFEEVLKKRTKRFAHECVKLASELPSSKLGKNIAGQLIRCSTSVPANYRSVCVAQSDKSFISKLGIVIEEADESDFWFEFVLDEEIHSSPNNIKSMMQEARELTKIFVASRLTMIKKLNDQSLKNKN